MAVGDGKRRSPNSRLTDLAGHQRNRSDSETRSKRDRRARSEFGDRRNCCRVLVSNRGRVSPVRAG